MISQAPENQEAPPAPALNRLFQICCGELRANQHCPTCGEKLDVDEQAFRGPKRVITVRLPKPLHAALIGYSRHVGVSMNALMAKAALDLLGDFEP